MTRLDFMFLAVKYLFSLLELVKCQFFLFIEITIENGTKQGMQNYII